MYPHKSCANTNKSADAPILITIRQQLESYSKKCKELKLKILLVFLSVKCKANTTIKRMKVRTTYLLSANLIDSRLHNHLVIHSVTGDQEPLDKKMESKTKTEIESLSFKIMNI